MLSLLFCRWCWCCSWCCCCCCCCFRCCCRCCCRCCFVVDVVVVVVFSLISLLLLSLLLLLLLLSLLFCCCCCCYCCCCCCCYCCCCCCCCCCLGVVNVFFRTCVGFHCEFMYRYVFCWILERKFFMIFFNVVVGTAANVPYPTYVLLKIRIGCDISKVRLDFRELFSYIQSLWKNVDLHFNVVWMFPDNFCSVFWFAEIASFLLNR